MKTQTMFLVGGCSGSFAAPSENRAVYDQHAPRGIRRVPFRRDTFGSRTTCYFLRHKDTFIVIDQGLGVEPVAEFIIAMLKSEGKTEVTIHCLQTHFHDDHLDGLRSNPLFFQKGLTLQFYSPVLSAIGEICGLETTYFPTGMSCLTTPTMDSILAGQFCASYWPVTLELLDQNGAKRLDSQFVPGAVFSLGEIGIQTIPLHHPGGAVGFRFEIPGVGVIVVATDYEPPPQPDPQIVEFYNGADLLLADMQYRDQEYLGEKAIGGEFGAAMPRIGWGHATPERLLPMLINCSRTPKHVRIVHHDPKRPDTDLQLFSEESADLLENWSPGVTRDFQFAREGEIFWL